MAQLRPSNQGPEPGCARRGIRKSCIVVFEEQHSFSSGANTRLCTAFLKAPATELDSWVWLHVHESPLKPEGAT